MMVASTVRRSRNSSRPALLFEGTPFEINRITLVRIVAVVALLLVFWLGTRKMRLVPGRFQSLVEMGLDLVRVNIADDLLGKKDGKRFLPILTTIFFMILFMNLTGIIPFLNIAGTSVIGVPLVLAIVAYVTFIYAGVKKSPKNFFKNSLFPPGVPWPVYIIVTPIEFISTFIIRPITLTLRLLMNMIVGHLLLVLFFAATQFFVVTARRLVDAARRREPGLRPRVHAVRDPRRRPAGLRLRPPHRGLHPARGGGRALSPGTRPEHP